MDETYSDNIDSQSIDEVVAHLPGPVRRFFASGKIREINKHIFETYGLHIDQAGIVQKELILLLLGINTPDEFTESLSKEARLDDKTITSIVDDVNKQIFTPLHEEMRSESVAPTPAQKTLSPESRTDPMTQISSATQKETPQEISTLPPKAALPRQTSAPATVPAAVPPRPPVSVPPAPTPVQQALPITKPSINKLAGWRSDMPITPEPQTSVTPPPAPSFAPAPPTTTQTPPTPSVPRTAPPPSNLPGTSPQIPPAQPPTPPIVKEYGSDPYREPIDDKA